MVGDGLAMVINSQHFELDAIKYTNFSVKKLEGICDVYHDDKFVDITYSYCFFIINVAFVFGPLVAIRIYKRNILLYVNEAFMC